MNHIPLGLAIYISLAIAGLIAAGTLIVVEVSKSIL